MNQSPVRKHPVTQSTSGLDRFQAYPSAPGRAPRAGKVHQSLAVGANMAGEGGGSKPRWVGNPWAEISQEKQAKSLEEESN